MKILADENIEVVIVQWLRSQKYDTLALAEAPAALPDSDVLTRANQESRIILTSDLDFGELVFRQRLNAHGIVLLRISASNSLERLAHLQIVWPLLAPKMPGHFVVISNRKNRIRPLSSSI